MELSEFDLFGILLRPLDRSLNAALVAAGWSPHVVEAVLTLLHALDACVLACVLAGGAIGIQRAATRAAEKGTGGRYAVQTVSAAIAVVAVGLFAWIVSHPSPDIVGLIRRFDHLALCAAGGYALSSLPPAWRRWSLSLGSLCILGQHAGWTPVEIVFGAGVLGFAALQVPRLQSAPATVCGQGIILAGTLLAAWRMRSVQPMVALGMEGLFAFVLLRHISFVVETRRGTPSSLGHYLCYMLFYPSCYGATEVYTEFHNRNLNGLPRFDYQSAVGHVVSGSLQIWLALLLPVSFEATVQIQYTTALWPSVLVLFVRISLFVMGLWALITACACFYGIELRPNFAGILWCENPSQFWHSWRGTMTNWLIHYVYIPLGGNRRLQARNIAAAFAVSTLWHWMGLPFVNLHVTTWDFVPMGAWGMVNALGVIGYAFVHRRDLHLLPATAPSLVRRAAKMFLTICFGTFTVTLLGFGPNTMAHFGSFLRILLGLRAW